VCVCACTSSQEHRKCNGIKGSMYKVMKSFVCSRCMNPATSTGCTSVDIGDNANLELVRGKSGPALADSASVPATARRTEKVEKPDETPPPSLLL